ncbi:hypothetical protein H109_06720 [Trichophyton interdigitale MR816]|uniref:Uncharacterized protein n=1 Tax=Trichophyton interdigitale (strain MR816) TaxID=1215338 RepID=A0A059J0D6_TRIIM|nr:hypothetical protein H109_06720 [Trichophyton interdigitale MR816]
MDHTSYTISVVIGVGNSDLFDCYIRNRWLKIEESIMIKLRHSLASEVLTPIGGHYPKSWYSEDRHRRNDILSFYSYFSY